MQEVPNRFRALIRVFAHERDDWGRGQVETGEDVPMHQSEGDLSGKSGRLNISSAAKKWLFAAGTLALTALSASDGSVARGLGSGAVWLLVFYFVITEEGGNKLTRTGLRRQRTLFTGFAMLVVAECFFVAHMAGS